MEDYRVQLDFYDGPMDLLLYLVRKEEVDIHDIPIARITEQYCRYVEMLRALDIDLAGEFLLTAAWLIEIKTRMLLPTDSPPPTEDGQPTGESLTAGADPRAELVRQLLAYKRFKDLADELGTAAASQALKYPRAGMDWKQLVGDDEELPALDLADVQIWDLFEAFGKLMEATGRGAFHNVTYDDTPIQEHEADIVDRLTTSGLMPFEKLFEGRERPAIIGLFLAMLELIRQKRIVIRQQGAFGSIVLSLRTQGEEPAPPAAEESSDDAEPRAARSRRKPDEPRGVTWVPPEEDETSDQELRLIDQQLKSILIPPDPDMLLKNDQPASSDEAGAPSPAAPEAGSPPSAVDSHNSSS